MKIAESSVNMTSERQFTQIGSKGKGIFSRTDSFYGIAKEMYKNSEEDLSDQWLNYGKNGQLRTAEIEQGKAVSSNGKPTEVQKSLLQELLERMKEYGLRTDGNITRTEQRISQEVVIQRQVSYSEQENTAFQAKGRAVTVDGRTIDFNVNLLMSRSYMEYTNVRKSAITGMLVDPLVINVGTQVTEISDQTFTFDLDADGTEEEIPMLGAGSGFLAYDANGDGKINDGGELFGAKTGDGFSELSQYDDDGNGWIDENDEIFSRLKVWCRNEKGEDVLMDLKAADVGAIYLGNQATEFSMKNADGSDRAIVRSSGFFLRESGSAGTMQQIDLAKNDPEELSQNEEQPIKYKEVSVITEFLGKSGSGEKTIADSATKEAAKDTESQTETAEERANRRAEQRQQMEARRLKKREQKKLLDEKFAKRRQEHKELLQRIQENSFEHRQQIRESYEWIRMRRSYGKSV